MKDFYMTLLSNSSLDYHPENKTGSFSNRLPRYINLDGDWEVALTEIHYPYTFFSIHEGENNIEIEKCVITKQYIDAFIKNKSVVKENKLKPPVKFKLTSGFYSEIKDIICALNDLILKQVGQPNFFRYDNKSHRVSARNQKLELLSEQETYLVATCKLSNNLALMLGYPPDTNVTVDSAPAPHVVNMSKCIADKMFIYCDIVEPQLFGDSFSKVLRVINTIQNSKPTFAQNCVVDFTSRHYIPVQIKHFESVSIDIRDITGELLPFQYGTSSIKLHFRRVKNV